VKVLWDKGFYVSSSIESTIITKQPYSNHARRMSYQLTELGQSLRPVLRSLARWGLSQFPEARLPDRQDG
jgi:DNA-binding HxlR family transcriptional regulator